MSTITAAGIARDHRSEGGWRERVADHVAAGAV
jgi:hypothetical protein